MTTLGRLPEFDDRSRGFAARVALFQADVPLRSKLWVRPDAWDQGAHPYCVGYACVGLLNTKPVSPTVPIYKRWWPADGLQKYVYHQAQKVDYWPGEDYDGTSVLAGMKVLKAKKLIPEYRWAFGLDDTLQTLSQYGPVVIGVNWYDSMFSTDEDGFLHIDGSRAGGHAIELHGLSVSGEYVIGTNSWGRGWGDHGRFRLRFADLDRLLREDGEAVTAVLTGRRTLGNHLWGLWECLKRRF